MEKNGGFMTFNDKSSPEDIKQLLEQVKIIQNGFRWINEKGLIAQDAEGCRLL